MSAAKWSSWITRIQYSLASPNSLTVRLAESIRGWQQLLTNRMIHAVTCWRRVNEEKRFRGMTGSCICTGVKKHTSLSSSSSMVSTGMSWWGQFLVSSFNYGGPSHQSLCSNSSKGKIPHEAQSAGVLAPITWLHLSGGIWSTIDQTRLPTYVLNLLGFP